MASLNQNKPGINDVKACHDQRGADEEPNYLQRAQWLRAAVLGATDGLVSTASLMMGIGAIKEDVKAMALSGFAGLVAGACSMAIGEYVSVHSQLDVELAHVKRQPKEGGVEAQGEVFSNPMQAAAASALSFVTGAAVPLLAAGFVRSYRIRLGLVAAVVTVALVAFGFVGAVLGRAPAARACVRVVVGGWMAMGVTFGLMKLAGSHGL